MVLNKRPHTYRVKVGHVRLCARYCVRGEMHVLQDGAVQVFEVFAYHSPKRPDQVLLGFDIPPYRLLVAYNPTSRGLVD